MVKKNWHLPGTSSTGVLHIKCMAQKYLKEAKHIDVTEPRKHIYKEVSKHIRVGQDSAVNKNIIIKWSNSWSISITTQLKIIKQSGRKILFCWVHYIICTGWHWVSSFFYTYKFIIGIKFFMFLLYSKDNYSLKHLYNLWVALYNFFNVISHIYLFIQN